MPPAPPPPPPTTSTFTSVSVESVTSNVPLDVNVWMVYSPTVVTVPPVARNLSDEHDDDDDDKLHSVAFPPALAVPVAHATHAPSFRY